MFKIIGNMIRCRSYYKTRSTSLILIIKTLQKYDEPQLKIRYFNDT